MLTIDIVCKVPVLDGWPTSGKCFCLKEEMNAVFTEFVRNKRLLDVVDRGDLEEMGIVPGLSFLKGTIGQKPSKENSGAP